MAETREIVVPGELVGEASQLRPGQNTYQEGTNIYALRLGVKTVRGDRVNVVALSGRYEPFRGDMVIGTVAELGPSNWYINIGAANDVGMHVNDVPWRVEFGETSKYLAIGETVLLKIVHVDEMKKAQVSMKDRQCRKLTGGIIFDVAPTKVPRIVGRNGSMIQLIKDATNVRMFVGQNGHVWLDGEADDVALALEALRKIEAEAHTTGLTDRMKAWLEERRPTASRPQRAPQPVEDEGAPVDERPTERPGRRERDERRAGERSSAEREERRERDERPPREMPRRERSAEADAGGQFDRDDRPPRRDDRPARRFEEERPPPRAERWDHVRSPRGNDRESGTAYGREGPRRRSDEDDARARSAQRRFEEDRPAPRRFEEERPAPRRFEEDRPRRVESREDDRPPRAFPTRRDDDADNEDEPRSARRENDRERGSTGGPDGPRNYGEADAARGGSGRRRRGGRGRSRGGRGGQE